MARSEFEDRYEQEMYVEDYRADPLAGLSRAYYDARDRERAERRERDAASFEELCDSAA